MGSGLLNLAVKNQPKYQKVCTQKCMSITTEHISIIKKDMYLHACKAQKIDTLKIVSILILHVLTNNQNVQN